MKKYISQFFGIAVLAVLFFVALPTQAQAAVSWNDNAAYGTDCPTLGVAIANSAQDACWGRAQSLTANPGQIVLVRVYYHNTGNSASPNTLVHMSQPSGSSNSFTITGGVSGGGASASGSVTINISGSTPQSLSYTGVKWLPEHQDNTAYPLPNGQSGSAVFSSLNIGTIEHWQSSVAPCPTNQTFCHQGSVLVAFTVSNTTTPPATCSITSFSANPSSVSSGSSSTISWTTSNCTNVSVSGPGVGSTATSGNQSTGALYNNATYTITASNASGSAPSQTATVSVNSNPPQSTCLITGFSANPTQVSSGSSSTISWTTSNCTTVFVSGQNINSTSHSGNQSTGALYGNATYTISASNTTNSAPSQTVTVAVSSNPPQQTCSITSFYASPTQVSQGSSSSLVWNTTGCTNASLSGGGVYSSSLNGSTNTGAIYGTNTYTLTASSSANTVTQTVTVSATQVPNQVYACQDGYDNDGDGLRDYPQDPGCSSYYDNDEYNYTNNNNYPPTVTTNAATNVTDSYATLNGYLSQQSSTGCGYYTGCVASYFTYYFQYGTSPSSLSYQTQSQTYNSSAGNVSAYINGLSNNTTYYFRLVGTNNYSTNYGQTLSFVTGSGTANSNVITTLATNITSSSARLNGLVTASNNYVANAYFEYGTTTALGSSTNSQNVSTNTLSNYFDTIATSPSTTYYYRAVGTVNGTKIYGSTVSFTTPGRTVITNTNTNTNTTTTTTTTNTNNFVAYGSGGGSPLVMLAINDGFTGTVGINGGLQNLGFTNQLQNVAPGDIITYTVHYKNISTATLSNVILNVVLPADVSFNQSSAGVLTTNNTVAASIGTLVSGQEGVVIIQGTVDSFANPGNTLIATATLSFTTPSFGQDSAIAYALNTISARNSLAGLALFGYGFFPHTLLGWIILLGIILIIILIARYFYWRPSQHVTIHNGPQSPHNLPH